GVADVALEPGEVAHQRRVDLSRRGVDLALLRFEVGAGGLRPLRDLFRGEAALDLPRQVGHRGGLRPLPRPDQSGDRQQEEQDQRDALQVADGAEAGIGGLHGAVMYGPRAPRTMTAGDNELTSAAIRATRRGAA